MKRLLRLLLLLGALPSAAAEVRVDGAYRLRLADQTNYLLDGSGARLGQEVWMEHRLRLSPKIVEPGQIEVQSSFDLVSGMIAGDLAPSFQELGWQGRSNRDGVHADGFDFRYLFVKLRLPFGIFELGQMPADWGMGMLINAGNQELAPDFGDQRFGDIVDRVLLAIRPFASLGPRSDLAQHVALAVAADLVYRDRYASLVNANSTNGLSWGDVAAQIVLALVYDPSADTRAGLYVARRWQDYAAGGGSLHAWFVDLHARTLFPAESLGATISLEAEGAAILGSTTHAPNLNAVQAKVRQYGAAGRALIARGSLEGEMEAGYASGDSNPFDDASTTFQFNRDFKVGLVLFDELLLFQTQNSARRLADPNLQARPPPGIDVLPTEGAVANAVYLKPTLRWRPSLLGGHLRLVGSVLFAWAAQPYVDPYGTFVGTTPVNPFGAPPGRYYGTEIDGALSWRVRLSGDVGYELGAQAGRLFPGDAFLMSDGSHLPPVNSVRFRATLLF